MALEAVVFQQDIFGFNDRDLYNYLEDHHEQSWSNNNEENTFVGGEQQYSWVDSSMSSSRFDDQLQLLNIAGSDIVNDQVMMTHGRRRRTRSKKNREEMENQRMTHIAVERNRRKQMNHYLSLIRSLMPQSYVQRSDQASTIGGAINYVRELEHHLDLIGQQNHKLSSSDDTDTTYPFDEAFRFPQFTTRSGMETTAAEGENVISQWNTLADIEVSLVESHASLKIRLQRRPKLLLNVITGLQYLDFTILHLNVSTLHHFVLYSLTLKVEDDCKLNSAPDIATSVYEMLSRIVQDNVVDPCHN